jgi:hypothetical protein
VDAAPRPLPRVYVPWNPDDDEAKKRRVFLLFSKENRP